jgi:hypothetical protein
MKEFTFTVSGILADEKQLVKLARYSASIGMTQIGCSITMSCDGNVCSFCKWHTDPRKRMSPQAYLETYKLKELFDE